MGIYYAIAKCFPQGLWDVSYYLYDLIRPYARPASGIPEFDTERCISKLIFDGLIGKAFKGEPALGNSNDYKNRSVLNLDYDLRLTEKCS